MNLYVKVKICHIGLCGYSARASRIIIWRCSDRIKEGNCSNLISMSLRLARKIGFKVGLSRGEADIIRLVHVGKNGLVHEGKHGGSIGRARQLLGVGSKNPAGHETRGVGRNNSPILVLLDKGQSGFKGGGKLIIACLIGIKESCSRLPADRIIHTLIALRNHSFHKGSHSFSSGIARLFREGREVGLAGSKTRGVCSNMKSLLESLKESIGSSKCSISLSSSVLVGLTENIKEI